MASPFRLFRKYMKTLLVIFGVMLMFAFVLGDALVGYLGGDRGPRGDASRDARAVAVQWDGGTLTNQELYDLVMRRRIVKSFVLNIVMAGEEAAMRAGVTPRQLRVEPVVWVNTPDTPEQGVERSVVQTRLFAQAAREAGMRVSDEMIVQHLDEIGRGNVTRETMREMLSRLQMGGWRVTIDYMMEALREEMLARNYIASYQFSFETTTPQQRWEDWLSVNDRIILEAAAVPAESFLIDVPEPTEAQIAEFYENHKQREPQPDFVGQMEFPSPTPGFAIPRKINVQYIQANYDRYVDKVEGEISDDEVEEFYEANKDLFIQADRGLIDDPAATEELEPNGAAAEGTEAETPITDRTEEAPQETTTPDVETPDVEQSPPAQEAEDAAPADEDQSRARPAAETGVFRLAAFLQESEQSEVEDAPPIDADSTDADTTQEEPGDPAGAAPPPAAALQADDPRAADGETSASADQSPEQYQPLDEVRDVIRRQLAEQRAAQQLDKQMNELASQLNAEFNTYFGQMLDAGDDEQPPPPPDALANLKPLAEQHGLEYGTTGPLSLLEMRDNSVGRSGIAESGVTLWRFLFAGRDVEPYQPMTTIDIHGNRYIVMMTSDTPGRVPELSEVRDDVVQAWKRQQAAELALKYAEERAKRAQESTAQLPEVFADNPAVEVVRTDPFSQLTGGDVAFIDGRYQQEPYRLSQPDAIIAAGPEFMRRVFELEEGEVAAVLNHDHSIAYVVRIVEHLDPREELRSAYLAEAGTWPGLRIMTSGHAQEAARYLVRDITTRAALLWLRPPDQIERDDQANAG